MLKAMLERAEHKVVEALTLQTAQEAVAESGSPQLAIVDMYLLGTYEEGIEVCRWAKTTFGIPLIAISAYFDPELKQKANQVADAVLRKPEDITLIIPTIVKLLQDTPQGAD